MDKDFDYENNVLKNKFEIKENDELHNIIREIIDEQIKEIFEIDDFEYTVDYLKKIHHKLFKSIYYFAGTNRQVNILKQEPFLLGYELQFVDYSIINSQLELFPLKKSSDTNSEVKEIVENLTFLWKIHPFRAGNTITCLIFVCKYVEKLYGYNIYTEIKKDYITFYVAIVLSNITNETNELFLFFKEIIDKNEKNIYNY